MKKSIQDAMKQSPCVMKAIDEYYPYFNSKRPHQALLYATPDEILRGITPKFSKGKYTGFKVKEANRRVR